MYWKASHCVHDCRYHIVWVTKYRRDCLNKKMQKRLHILLQGICKELYIKIIRIGMEGDHVHMYVSVPPVQPIPYVVKTLKGRTSKILRKEFANHLKQFYWKGVLWAVGYFVSTVGEVSHEIIKKYVENQGRKDIEEECIPLEATDF